MLIGLDSTVFSVCPFQLIKWHAPKTETFVFGCCFDVKGRLDTPALKNIVEPKKLLLGFWGL